MDPGAAANLQETAAGPDRLALSLDGGQLLSWVCAGRERLFLSPRARTGPGQAIRGGVPVIFPQFGTFGPGARHGFARLQRWQAVEAATTGEVCAELRDSPETRAAWPHAFRLRLSAQATPGRLTLALTVENTGDRRFEFTTALHTYLAVDDLGDCALHGLAGRPYLDAAGGGRRDAVHDDAPLRFAGEVDRVYAGADELRLSAPAGDTCIGAHGFSETVVWNPGAALAAGLADLGADQQARFVCIEAAVVRRPVSLEPGARWQGRQIVTVANP